MAKIHVEAIRIRNMQWEEEEKKKSSVTQE